MRDEPITQGQVLLMLETAEEVFNHGARQGWDLTTTLSECCTEVLGVLKKGVDASCSVGKLRIEAMKTTLTLSDKERQCLEGFLEEHGDCIDSKLIFEVSSDNGIGVATVVICQCGEKRDITDYGLW